MIRCPDGALYTGVTLDVARRFAEHEAQGSLCAKYLRGKAPLKLVYQVCVGDKRAAYQLEYELKRYSKREKESLLT